MCKHVISYIIYTYTKFCHSKTSFVSGLTLITEIISTIIVSGYAMVAGAAGIGGGPVYTSILIAFGTDAHVAIPISNAIICSGAFVLMWFNIAQKSVSEPTKPEV